MIFLSRIKTLVNIRSLLEAAGIRGNKLIEYGFTNSEFIPGKESVSGFYVTNNSNLRLVWTQV